MVETPYLVVGAGPVGLMAGILLGQSGLSTQVIDRDSGTQESPAAHVVNARTLEICRQAGLDSAGLAGICKPPEDAGHAIFVTRLNGDVVGRLPFERQGAECLRFTPTPLRNISQNRFESFLESELLRKTKTRLNYQHRWESAEQDDEGVTSKVRDLKTGELLKIRSRYLIAADGAGSRIRKSIGIEMDGPPKLQSFVMIHVQIDLRELVRDRPGVLYWILDPAAGGVFVAHDIDREWVYMHEFDSDHESLDDYDEARCHELVTQAIGQKHPMKIRNRLTWTMSAQTASTVRDRRIFLVGDAAHRFPPTGGLGLNTGIQDIHALAWRLNAIEKRWADSSLLKSYAVERVPVAQNNAEQSLRNAGKLLAIPAALGTLEDASTTRMRATLDSPEGRTRVEESIADQAEHFDMLGLQLGYIYASQAILSDTNPTPTVDNPVREYAPSGQPGARLPHTWLRHGEEKISSLDLIRPSGFTLLTGGDPAGWSEAVSACADWPIELVEIEADAEEDEGAWSKTCGLEPGGAILVRPDQHVAWRSPSKPEDPRSALLQVLNTITPRAEAGL
ncbi:MAG: FAD-dependent monooxygenase [Myxococcota bacterium]|nr:FAD-dependent monooxygenase [Myxococcota bacterium]